MIDAQVAFRIMRLSAVTRIIFLRHLPRSVMCEAAEEYKALLE